MFFESSGFVLNHKYAVVVEVPYRMNLKQLMKEQKKSEKMGGRMENCDIQRLLYEY